MASASGAAPLPDPHNISHSLDDQTCERIISRLESRGKDAVFRALFEGFLPKLRGCQHVLELGCGTGVLVRAIAKLEGFAGKVTGADQSRPFLAAAHRLAEEEGCDMSRIAFVEVDAHSASDSAVPGGPFDAVVMSTLLSHVSDPLAVLRQAASLAAPLALLVVMDGDYPSLAIAHQADPEFGEVMSRALVRATFAQPDVIRRLPRLLPEAGWRLVGTEGRCVSEIGGQASYWVSFCEAYMPRVKQACLVDPDKVDAWWSAQQAAIRENAFFAAAAYYTFFAQLA